MCFPFFMPMMIVPNSESDTEDEFENVCVLCGDEDAIVFDLCEECEEVVAPARCDGCHQVITMNDHESYTPGKYQEINPGDENNPPNDNYAFCPECLNDYLREFPDPSEDDDDY